MCGFVFKILRRYVVRLPDKPSVDSIGYNVTNFGGAGKQVLAELLLLDPLCRRPTTSTAFSSRMLPVMKGNDAGFEGFRAKKVEPKFVLQFHFIE